VAVPFRTLLATCRRRRRLRTALAGRSLAIFRTVLTEPGGRPTAVRLAAISFAGDGRHARGRCWADGVAAAVERLVHDGVDTGLEAWRDANEQMHAEFWSRRMARERAISDAEVRARALRQPGLFDRRSEQQYGADEAASAALSTARREHIAAAERARDVVIEGPRPALLLIS
jgi:hypothetical protein